VLCTTVVHNGTHTHEQFLRLRMSVGLGLVCVSWLSFDYFVRVFFAFVVSGLVSSELRQEIG